MSKTIDERVVEMRFDNKQFESNVATSMSTLEKLKKSLKFDGATKGLEEINAAAGKVNMSGLGSGVDSVKAKFSALDVIAVTALANITNSAVNAGKQLVSSLSIDQLTEGWQKFSDKTTSVATLVAQGNAIEDVNAQLDRLNWFTDETSYNFTEMVANIAKFTATGKGLEESVTAMEGIATWAALSGQNAATASRAMYQLSQAMGAGVMRLEDYKSIQNASMDTEEFRQKCLAAAVSLGTLKDNGDGTYKSLVKGASDTSFNISQFTTNLTEGMWLTSDVMMEVFNTYSAAVEGIYEAAEEKGMLASEVIDEIYETAEKKGISTDEAIKTLGYDFDSFALKAFEAAQKARTFSDAIDSVKDAVSTGWMNTFELIFGDANQATKLWTEVANQLYDIFAGGAERRNGILENVMVSGWDKLIERINDAGIETSDYEERLKQCAEAGGINVEELTKKYGSLGEAFRAGAIDSKYLKEAFSNLQTTVAKTTNLLSVDLDTIKNKLGFGSYGDDVKKVQTALEELGFSLDKFGVDGIIGAETTQAIKDFQESVGLVADGIVGPETLDALKKAGSAIEEIGEASEKSEVYIDDLIDSITRPSGQELIFDTISNSLSAVSKVVETFREAWAEIFTDARITSGLYNALSTIQKASEKLVNFLDDKADKLKSTFKGVIAILDILTSIVGGALSAAFEMLGEIFGSTDTSILDITGSVGDAIVWFRNWLAESKLITEVFSKLVSVAKDIINVVKRWIDAFANIPFVSDLLSNIKQLFSDISSDVNDGTNKVEKWVGSFDGLSVAVKILDKIGEALKWIGGVVEDSIPVIGAWLESFKETEGVQQLVTAITDLFNALGKLFSGEINANEFASTLGNSLANILMSLPKMAIQIGKDFIAGFQNGITDSVGSIINDIVSFCLNFVSAFAEALGVQSPSWKAYETATDFFQGFINGAKDMISSVLDVLKNIGEQIVKVFKSFWNFITDESGNIEWGKIFAGGSIVAMIWVLKQLANAFSGIANALGGIDDLLANAGKVLKSFSKVLNGIAWDLKAQALQKMAVAIGILVASIWVLTTIDDPAKLWNAVGVIAVLAGVLVALSIAMDKLSSASVQVNKKGVSLDGLKTGLLQIGIAILLIAVTAKLIGDMDPDEAKQGFIGLAGIAVGMLVFLKAIGKVTGFDKDISSVGTMMKKLAVAMILMVVACKLVGMLSAEDMLQGAAFAAGFAIFVIAITKVAKSAGNNVSKVGGMVLKLTVAMALMVGVCKLVGSLSAEEMLKGAAFAAAFVLFVAALVKVTKIGKKQQIAKLGGLILSISVSLLLMVGVCKLVGKLTVGEMVKGAVFVAAFVVLLKALVKILTIGNEQQLGKVAGTILAMSAAIAIMAGVAVLLGFMPLGGLAKGIIAVGLLSAMMAVMVKSLKGAQNAKGAILMMAIAIGVMAASIIALSFIDTQSLASAAGAMTIVMSAFALMIKSMSGIKNVKVGPLIALTGVVLVLAGIIYILQDIDPLSAISSVGSLAVLMLAMSAVLVIISKISVNVGNSLKGILALTLMAIPLLALVGVLALMSGVENATANTKNLIALATTLTLLLIPLTVIGAIATTGVGAAAVGLGITALLLMCVPLLALVGVLALMSGVENATANSELLINFMTTMTDLLLKVSLVAPLAALGVAAMTGLTLLMGAIGVMAVAIGALMDESPNIQKFLDAGLPVLEQLAGSIGTMIGKFIGGIGEGLGDSLVKIGVDIAAFMAALSLASMNASAIKGESFDGVKQLMDVMGDIALTTVGTTIGDIFTLGGTSMEKFQKDGVAFFDAMKAIGEASSGVNIDEESMSSVIGVAQKLADLQSSLEPIGGVISWFTGRDDLATFGVNAGQFVSSMMSAFGSLGDANLDTESMNSVIGAATSLAELQSSLEPIGGVISWFTGRDDLGTFGVNVGAFVTSMVTAFGSLSNVSLNTEAMDSIISAATSLAGLQSSLEPIGGVISWFTGRDDLGTFGVNVGAFISSMVTAFGSLVDIEFNTEAMDSIISAATSLAGLQSSLEPIGGVVSWFAGRDDLGTFGVNVGAFVSSMKTALATLDGATLNEEALTSVITAAKKLSELQSKLEPMGGVVSWFSGRTDLGTFGTNIGLFADAMGKLKTGMGENGISEEVVTSVTNAGNAIIALQKALPEEHWFDGKMNLTEFSEYITDFATAMSTFGTKAAEIDSGAVSTVISTAYRIKSLIESLVDLDTSGVDAFTGIGTGGIGADGPAYDIARAISKFGNEVKNINTDSVTVAVSAAKKLKSLIASLVGLDTSGIENFKPGEIGKQIKNYADKVASVNATAVSRSISAANHLKNFITGLSGLDSSGIKNFKPGAIGESLKEYSASVSSFNSGTVSSSISAASRLKTFITGLAGLDTSGVASFKTAINNLATVNIAELTEAFSGAAVTLSKSGVDMMNGLINGMKSKSSALTSTANSMVTATIQTINSKASLFLKAGQTLGSNVASGISNKRSTVVSAASSCASSAASAMRGYYNAAYNAGYYLVSGFASGITANTWMATARASAMASAAISAAKSVLRINSPSKVFKEIGSGVPEGFALGIGMLGGEVKRSVTGMASTAIDTTRSAMTTVLNALNTDMDAQPTIRPVVDLSDVRTGAAAVSGMFNGLHTVGVRSNLNAINIAMNDKLQNGTNQDVVTAINKLRDGLDSKRGDTYNFGGITYDDGSNISEAVSTLVRAAKMGRRV